MPRDRVTQILREEDSRNSPECAICRDNPMVVTTVYLRTVKSLGLVPQMLRIEHENEAPVMAAAHCT